jgi:hypothetical protein
MFWRDSFITFGLCSGLLSLVAMYRLWLFPKIRVKQPLKKQTLLIRVPLIFVFPCIFSVLSELFHPSESPQWLRIALLLFDITLPFITLLALIGLFRYLVKHNFELRGKQH